MQGWTWDSITRLDIGIVEKRAPGIIGKDRHVDPHIFWMQPSGTARCPTQVSYARQPRDHHGWFTCALAPGTCPVIPDLNLGLFQ